MAYERRRGVDGDDSLLASVAGVPLTRLARIAVCLIWAGFWAARVLLTDALVHFNALDIRAAFSELLGTGSVDQAFSICMIWLTVEVAIVYRVNFENRRDENAISPKQRPKASRQAVLAETLTKVSRRKQLEAIVLREKTPGTAGKGRQAKR